MGGEATLARVAELEGMPYAALVSLFNDTRSKDYDEVSKRSPCLSETKKLARPIRRHLPTSSRSSKRGFKKSRRLTTFSARVGKTFKG